MKPEQQQRIMGYFIEEAKDHLNTIEQGLLKLQHTLDDPEIVNEMFRAAHSVKGGAAMLGLNSIQYVSHRLEDFFKVMSEAQIQSDQRLETLLLRVFDALQALIEQLQGPFGLTDDTVVRILSDVEPLFGELEHHLESSKQGSRARFSASTLVDHEELDLAISSTAEPPFFPNPFEPAWKTIFRSEVPGHLRAMLALFKASETSNTRQQLQQICDQLAALDNRDQLGNWCHLIGVSRQAIAAPDHTFRNIAPVIIRDIKRAHDLILADQISDVVPSSSLMQLAAVSSPVTLPDALTDISLVDGLSEPDELTVAPSLQLISDPLAAKIPDASEHPDDRFGNFLEPSIANPIESEVGMTELNALADLFEGELPDLGEFWQEQEFTGSASEGDDLHSDSTFVQGESDFLDLLLDRDEATPLVEGMSSQDELSALFGDSLGEEGQFPADDQDSERAIQTFEAFPSQSGATESLDLDDLFRDFSLIEDNQSADAPLAFSETAAEPAGETNEVPDPWAELDQPTMATAETEQALSLADLDFSDFLAREDTPFDQLLHEEGLLPELPGDSATLDQFDFSDLLDSPETPVPLESLESLPHALSMQPPDDLGLDVLESLELEFISDPDEVLDEQSELFDLNPITDIEAVAHYTELELSPDLLEEAQPPQSVESFLTTQGRDVLPLVEDSPEPLVDILAGEESEPIWSQEETELTLDGLFTPAPDIPSGETLEFADLDALLGEDFETATPVISMPEPSLNQSATVAPESDFDELDALLKEAEETLGGSPSVKGVNTLGPQLRRPARQSRVLGEQTMRVPVKHLDNLSNLVGELVVNRNSLEEDQERLRQSLDNLLYQVQQLGDVGQRMQDLYERSLLETSLLARRVEDTFPRARGEYDPLEMDRFTGFHSLSQEMIELIVRVRESASDIDFIVDETEQVTRSFRQVTTQLQEGLNRSRMVPFAQIADRLPRAVRDISLKMGKQAELVIEGRDTLIDKMILEQLYDPMTHLVNNAITHGIEAPAVRRAAGKSAAGRILIQAFHQGNQTIISVSDDGSGIDMNRVKEKAIEKRLITPAEARDMSHLDIYDLLFHPGFTTKDQADDFSGRGVGMDVVRTCLNEIRGTITTDSTAGEGTTFTIRLPLTLSISKALCCISDLARIAFPMDGVEDMLDVTKDQIQTDAEGHSSLTWRGLVLPIRPLSELLTYNRQMSRGNVYGGSQDDNIVSVVVLRSAGNYLALQVDQVLGEQEIVIKQLEGPVPKPIGIAGATVLGDGRIMPIADILELIDLSMGRIRRDAGSSLWVQGTSLREPDTTAVKTQPTVLIVDDSITVRELLSMTFNKVGYRVEQARDGQEAWEKLRSGMPCNIVFCDIEMPRMDGLELLSRIEKDSHLSHIPVAMLTSRGADRHRQMAASLGAKGYFTKPYLEEALLDAAQRMLQGEMLIH
ncbi:MAG: response regulator [Leptolyngbyaceae cyanobacterium]